MDSSGERNDPVATTVREVLEDQPVRLGVLFGSQARGTAGTHSDVDVAVEFDESVDDRFRARLTLGADLARALGTDDVDVVDLDDMRPAIGYSALDRGRVLVGDPDRAKKLAEAFEREREASTSRERRERFDETLDRLEELV